MKRVGFVVGLTLLGLSTAHADFQAGLNAYNSKDFPKAVTLWQTEAMVGDHNSQYNLGLLFEKGVEGYPKNLAIAYGWYRLAASQNVPEAQKAVDRIKGLMTAGQIETGNNHALEVFGKWHRRNVGRDEAEYQAAKATFEKQRQAKIEIERQAAAARADRQRNLISQREADAKLAIALDRESKQAAVTAAQEKAEEAKRLAFIEKRRKEDETRLAALRVEQQQQKKIEAARSRLEQLKAKQNKRVTVVAPTVKASPTVPVVAAPLKEEVSPVTAKNTPKPDVQVNKVVTTSPSPDVPLEKPKTVIVTKTVVASAPVKKTDLAVGKVNSETSVANIKTESETALTPVAKPNPVLKLEKTGVIQPAETVTKTRDLKAPEKSAKKMATPVEKEKMPTAAVVKPKVVATKTPSVSNVETKPYKAQVIPSKATILAAKPADAGKMKLPTMMNGLDVAVVKEIVEKANSVSLDTGVAKQEISEGRTNIEALKWSLISAARGKGSAKRINVLLEKSMTSVQIAEANRMAAIWINIRQKRQ